MKKKLPKSVLTAIVPLSMMLVACGNHSDSLSSKVDTIVSNDSIYTTASQTWHQDSTTNVITTTNVVEEMLFDDNGIRNAARKALGLKAKDIFTEDMCAQITMLEQTSNDIYVSTLTDLQKFPNLETLIIDNHGYNLDMKGINKAPNLKSLSLIHCPINDVERIGDITTLEYLNLATQGSNVRISDYSPLANNTRLKYLNLDGHYGNGFEPVDMSFMYNLTELEELHFHPAYPDYFSNLPIEALIRLKKISISANVNVVYSELVESGAINTIEYLYVTGSGIEAQLTNETLQNYVSKAKNAKFLYMDIGKLTTLSGLGELQNLESLVLNNDYSFDLPCSEYAEISKLEKLKELIIYDSIDSLEYVKNNYEVQFEAYSFLNGMDSLEYLTITLRDEMSIDNFTNLPKLKQLTINGTGFYTGKGIDISSIGGFKSLEKFFYSSELKLKSTAPLDDITTIKAERTVFNSYNRLLYPKENNEWI